MKKRKKNTNIKDFFNWSLTFTKKLIVICTVLWAFCILYSAVMILYAVIQVGDFSYLDSFITDNGETFRIVVGVNLISKTVENVFKYNNGGLFGTSLPENSEEALDKPSPVSQDDPEG